MWQGQIWGPAGAGAGQEKRRLGAGQLERSSQLRAVAVCPSHLTWEPPQPCDMGMMPPPAQEAVVGVKTRYRTAEVMPAEGSLPTAGFCWDQSHTGQVSFQHQASVF